MTRSVDSIYVKEVIRDTTFKIEPDSATIKLLLECDSVGQVHIKRLEEFMEGRKLKPPDVEIKNNVLTAVSRSDSLAIYMALKDRYVSKIKERIEIKEVNRLTWWQKLWVKLGKILTALMVGLIIIKIKR